MDHVATIGDVRGATELVGAVDDNSVEGLIRVREVAGIHGRASRRLGGVEVRPNEVIRPPIRPPCTEAPRRVDGPPRLAQVPQRHHGPVDHLPVGFPFA